MRNICNTCVRYSPCSFILLLFISLSKMTTCDVCYTSVHCSFRVSVNVACMEDKSLSMTASRTLGFGRRRYGWLFLAIAGLFAILWVCYSTQNN